MGICQSCCCFVDSSDEDESQGDRGRLLSDQDGEHSRYFDQTGHDGHGSWQDANHLAGRDNDALVGSKCANSLQAEQDDGEQKALQEVLANMAEEILDADMTSAAAANQTLDAADYENRAEMYNSKLQAAALSLYTKYAKPEAMDPQQASGLLDAQEQVESLLSEAVLPLGQDAVLINSVGQTCVMDEPEFVVKNARKLLATFGQDDWSSLQEDESEANIDGSETPKASAAFTSSSSSSSSSSVDSAEADVTKQSASMT